MKWRTDMENAPKDGTRILAIADPKDGYWDYLAGRWFVIHHGTVDWSAYPGLGVGDDFFRCWMPLDALPPPPEGER